jgi:lysozyme family protein
MYKAKYWDAVQGDHLPSGVHISVADFGVGHPERQNDYRGS